jgi:hypothetical protein
MGKLGDRQQPCGNARCVRYDMTQMEFRKLRGELWDASFISKFGKRAVKLYNDIYGKPPRLRRSRTAKRNHVNLFPCGILEQAYEQLRNEGVPLVQDGSWVDQQLSTGQRVTLRWMRDEEIPPGHEPNPQERGARPKTYVPSSKEDTSLWEQAAPRTLSRREVADLLKSGGKIKRPFQAR